MGLGVRRAGGGQKRAPTATQRRDQAKTKGAQLKPLAARHARSALAGLYRHTRGLPFRPQAFGAFLRLRLRGKGFRMPKGQEAEKLLCSIARRRRTGSCAAQAPGVWYPRGTRYADPEGLASVENIVGHKSGSGWVSWHEYGTVYRVRRAEAASGKFVVTAKAAHKTLSSKIARRSLTVRPKGGAKARTFKGSVVLNPRRAVSSAPEQPRWTLIYLHSFSNKGTDYIDYPHYFGVSNASVRVVLPSAPDQEQTCFKDWNVWKGQKLGWRRIKFSSWFDYLTDKAGSGENGLCIESLLEMRAQLHCLIRSEVQRLGGDAKRVIVGGASQGCCVALDAALTYPEELGGVVGLVGHVLGNTPLDPAKRSMPIHLFHEATDREMNWRWVKDTVQRLRDHGFNVHSKRERDPSGSGHWIQEIEGDWIRGALRRIVGGAS